MIVSQEWPEFNDLWKCPVYSANSECLRFRSRLDRCRFTRFREWKAYRIQATWRLEEVLCSHERSQHRKVDLYSRASTRFVWESICSRRPWRSFFEKRPLWSRQMKKG